MVAGSPNCLVDEHRRLVAAAGLVLALCTKFDLALDAGEVVEFDVSFDPKTRFADQFSRHSALKACLGSLLVRGQCYTSDCWVSGAG